MLSFGPEARFRRRTRQLVRRLHRRGVPLPTAGGWLDWGRAVQDHFPWHEEFVGEYCGIICAFLYGGQALDPS
jgi:hypothetical protein